MDVSLALRLAALFVVGASLGSLVNWAIYSLAWNPRPVSPWMPAAAPRRWLDRVPIVGWFALRREAPVHGAWFWVRPLLIEVGTGATVAAIYWWEVEQAALVRGQFAGPFTPPMLPLYFQFLSHVLLLCLILAASFIDIDEQIVPDEITVPGTVLGLGLAAFVPMSLLPHVAERAVTPIVGTALANAGGGQVVGPDGGSMWLEPVTATAPQNWPAWAHAGDWRALVIGLACYWLWCFALAPRIWRGRRGAGLALRLIVARVNRELSRPPLRRLLFWGTAVIVFVWAIRAQAAWTGLLTALLGLVGSGGIVWAVRLMGSFSLRREAMGFGDVTMMMMIGTFLGWQAGIILFFLSPFAAVLIGLLQFLLRRDDAIPFIPYLGLAAAAVVVAWAPIWVWAEPVFTYPRLVIAALAVCLVLLGFLLFVWRLIKTFLFDRAG